ncbi:MAG: helix-turn-helix domain-containing protein [Prevotella sp.]|nr:helix-turn-helix domain-containing protein [Staphylococcus sp.]MCM1349567.1 helix-turn-helix domain-containing protein [Prevotella sp.]
MKLDYATAIINLRIKLNLSQMALAELLGVSFTSVNRWENGKYAPTKLAKKKIELLCQENGIQMEVIR